MDIDALATELTAGHPDTGSYNADDALATAELNAVNRPAASVTIAAVLSFLLLENTHKTDNDDTKDRAIWTRMKDVDALAVTPTVAVSNPWGSTAIGNVTAIRAIKTKQLLEYFTLSAQGDLAVDLTEANFVIYLAGAQAAGCMSTAQETALKELGDNLQSRAVEIGLGTVKVGHVEQARA